MCYVSVIKPNLYAYVVFPMYRKRKQKLLEEQKKAPMLTEIEEVRTEVRE